MRAQVLVLVALAQAGCRGDKASSHRIAAYESTDPCSSHGDEAACSADFVVALPAVLERFKPKA